MIRRLLFALALIALPAHAGPWHFVKTHKSELARVGIVYVVYFAAAKTEQCYRPAPCSDKSYWFPSHPTRPEVYGSAAFIGSTFAVLQQLQHHYDPEPDKRTSEIIGWAEAGLFAVNESWDISQNLHRGE